MQDRIWKKVKDWKEKSLCKASKNTLIKPIAQSISNYIMSCFKIPEGTCKEIETLVAKFWWGSTNSQRKIHWIS